MLWRPRLRATASVVSLTKLGDTSKILRALCSWNALMVVECSLCISYIVQIKFQNVAKSTMALLMVFS